MAGNKDIKCATEIMALTRAMAEPKPVAIMHYPGHKKRETLLQKRNQDTGRATKEAAEGDLFLGALKPQLDLDPL